jgi:hypothetical protein
VRVVNAPRYTNQRENEKEVTHNVEQCIRRARMRNAPYSKETSPGMADTPSGRPHRRRVQGVHHGAGAPSR